MGNKFESEQGRTVATAYFYLFALNNTKTLNFGINIQCYMY
jgi:hypothetical protein